MRQLLLAAATAICVAAPTFAETPDPQDHGDHDQLDDAIVVTGAIAKKRDELLSGSTVLSAETLAREMRPTIGETLSRQAGISSTSFGPNASRPVLRGFQGERVRILTDGIGSFDVSNTSVDHAVIINPLTADRIEVLRGPAVLLFGSSAIGGVVNVIDSRIPRSVPDEPIHIDAIGTYGSAANERSATGRIDIPLGGKIVFHFDGTFTKTGDQRIGGFVLTPGLRAAAASSADEDINALADLKGTLPNSASRTLTVAGGAAIITDNGNLGVSISQYDSLYGIPLRYSVDPAVEAESVRLNAKQTRVDVRSEVRPASGFVETIKFRGGFADYLHNEIDDEGAIGTTFLNKGWEGRLELAQRQKGSWRGSIGGQFLLRNLNIIGDEKFLPKSETSQFGLFTVQNFDLGAFRTELGARIERSTLTANADADLGNPDLRRAFTAASGSTGASYGIARDWRVGLNLSYTERAPSGEELFANGPHAGTQAFEIGNPDFNKEKSTSIEGTLRGKGPGYSVSASVYHSWFDGFIFEAPTGAIEDDLPVLQFSQANARYYGAEFEASVALAKIGGFAINLEGLGDFTRAKISNGGSIPRIPALRLLGGLEANSDLANGRVEIEWVDGQSRIASFETATKGYSMVNASIDFKPLGNDNDASITLSANNIFNVEARRHASFLKDYAPLAGRDIRITLHLGL